MNDIFRMGPPMLGPAFLAGDANRPPHRYEDVEEEELENRYPWVGGATFRAMRPSQQRPKHEPEEYEGLPLLSGPSDVSNVQAGGDREAPPTERCNPYWDPGCPRTMPDRTLAPYVPSSYLQGSPIVFSVSNAKPRPRDRSGRIR